MRLSGAGLTALVAVLFVVLLQQVRQQGQRIQTLQEKVQSLENSNDLERTNALEEQLRSTVTRLQNLEGLEQSVQRLSLEQASLRAQVRRPLPEPDLSLETPPEPPSKAGRPSKLFPRRGNSPNKGVWRSRSLGRRSTATSIGKVAKSRDCPICCGCCTRSRESGG